ncbi:MAG: type II toxin-antitoxin system VapC family toxin [Egibacteraceae bacterium]
MSTLVDSSVLIDVLRDTPGAADALKQRRRSGLLHSSVVVSAEVLAGMRPAEEPRTRGLLELLEWHAVDELIAEEAGRLGRRWLRSHNGIDIADLLVAATAKVLDLELLTRNVRHFPMFPGLAVPY